MITVDSTKLQAYKEEQYKKRVPELIREKYSKDDEYDCINKGITDSTNTEYVAYRNYVSQCKAKAKTEIFGN